MKIFGDLHLGLSLSYYVGYPDYVREKFLEILGGDREFISTGDTFHNAGAYSEELLFMGMYKHWFPQGNGKHAHDIYKQRRTYEELFATKGMKKINGKGIYFQSHLSGDEIENFDYGSIPECDILITHNFITEVFKGCKHLDWKELKKKCKVLIAGHYHKQEDVANGVYYIGSFVNTDFGSANEKGRYFDLEKGEFVYYDIKPFITYFDENAKVNSNAITRLKTSEIPSVSNRSKFNLIQIVRQEELEESSQVNFNSDTEVIKLWEEYAGEEKEIYELGKKYLEG